MEYRDRVLDSCLGSHTLDGLDHDLLSLLIGIELGIIHDLIDVAGCIKTSLVLQAFHQAALRLLGTESGKLFELSLLLLLHLLEFLLLHGKEFLLIVDALLKLLYLLLAATEVFLALVERDFALLELVFTLLDAGVALLHLLLQLGFLIEELLLYFEKLFLLYYFCLFVGSIYHFIIFSLNDITENDIPHDTSQHESYQGRYYCYHIYIIIINILT